MRDVRKMTVAIIFVAWRGCFMSIRKYLEDVAFALIILIAYRALWVGEVITFSSFLGLLASCAIGVGAYQAIKFALIRIKKIKVNEGNQ